MLPVDASNLCLADLGGRKVNLSKIFVGYCTTKDVWLDVREGGKFSKIVRSWSDQSKSTVGMVIVANHFSSRVGQRTRSDDRRCLLIH